MGVAVLPLVAQLVQFQSMSPGQTHHSAVQLSEWGQNPIIHLLLHVTLLHGVVGNNILPESQYMFIAPAWSLSLEWQFYLIAPFFVWGLIKKPAVTTSIVLVFLFAYNRGAFGSFYNPSLLMGAAWYFLIGIVTRIHVEALPEFDRFPVGAALAMVPFVMIERSLAPFVIWAALVLYFRSGSSWPALDGKVARKFGERSFSAYVLHFPIVIASAWAAWGPLHLSPTAAMAFTAVATIVGTAIFSAMVFRFIEQPFVRIGKRLGRGPITLSPSGPEPAPASQGW